MKLKQFSLESCPPCKAAKRYIEDTFDGIGYEYIDASKTEEQENIEIMMLLRTRKVPHFVIMSTDNKILHHFTGFDKESINYYAEMYKDSAGKMYAAHLFEEDEKVEDKKGKNNKEQQDSN